MISYYCPVGFDEEYYYPDITITRDIDICFPLSNYIINGLADAAQVGRLYRRSKICLNMHAFDHTSLNPMTFEILATRSFELMDERKTDDLLRPGIDIVMYTGIDDLLDKIDYYLTNEQEREQIADNGYEWVKSRYTIKQMAKNMIEPYSG